MKPAPVDEGRQLSSQAVVSLVLHSLFQFAGSLSLIFVNIYLWRLTEDFTVNAVYYLLMYFMIPFGFIAGGYIAKKYDRMVTFRTGILTFSLFYLLILIVGENVPHYYVLFGILQGLAMGFYWSGILVLMYDVSTNENRMRYMGLNNIFFTVAGLLGPLLAGSIISRSAGLSGYLIVFGLSFLVFLMTAVGSFRIRRIETRKKPYYLKFVGLLARKNKTWSKALVIFFIYGLLQGIMMFLPNILLYEVIKREDVVGYGLVGFSLVSIFASYLLSKYGNLSSTKKYITWAAFGFVAGSALLFMGVNLYTVIGFMAIHAFFNPLFNSILISYYYLIVSKLPLKGQLRIESVVVYESVMNYGRFTSIFVLLLFVNNLQSHIIPIFIFVVSVLQLISTVLIERVTVKAEANGTGEA